MLFNSFPFILAFLPLTLLIFFQLSKGDSMERPVLFLILASLVFYGWINPRYIYLILCSFTFNYGVGRLLETEKRSTLLALGIAYNLTLLAAYKYIDFFVSNILRLFLDDRFFVPYSLSHNIALPLAISFFTFQQIAYLVDVYKGRVQSDTFCRYSLFITFFPQLIAGPICRHSEILPQIRSSKWYRPDWDNLAIGATLFFIGLFKKTVIADGVGKYGNALFNTLHLNPEPGLFEAWGGTLAFTFQIYFDFSGYSDMALGLARMFNLKLPLNFFSPYKSKSIIEFWRSWHITLSHFLRDFLYIPLGGNRHGSFSTLRNLVVTMLLGGLWHGAGWHFTAWGGVHGVYLAVNHKWASWVKSKQGLNQFMSSRTMALISWLSTFLAIALAWVLFRANDLEDAIRVYRGLFGMNGVSIPNPIANALGPAKSWLAEWGVQFPLDGARPMTYTALWNFALLWLTALAPNVYQILERYQPALDYPPHTDREADRFVPGFTFPSFKWHPSHRWAMGLALIAAIGILGISTAEEFIYFQF